MPGARLVKCLIVLAIILSLLISSWSRKWLRAAPYNSDLFQGMETYTSNQSRHHEKEQLKKVLFWNEPYPGRKKANQASGVNGEFSVSEYVQLLEGCASEHQCEITSNGRTSDPDVLKRYHAIVFHQRSWNFVDIPKHRWPHQRYVFLSMESPAWKFIDSESMAGFFNWTMTYRRDSDIHNPYGWFSPLQVLRNTSSLQGEELSRQRLFKKKRMAAWFVSNCDSLSGRNEFVKELGKYIDVDVYGRCGNLRCPRSQSEKCNNMVEQNYKFYLSLENSLCQDYITEKLFAIMHYYVVPVVFDLHGNLERIAPKRSFVNAANFLSVKHLAEYLVKLNQNDALYNSYFSWKKHYAVRDSKTDLRQGMCKLCSLLHNRKASEKVYQNMTDWWDSKAKCQTVRIGESSSVWKAY